MRQIYSAQQTGIDCVFQSFSNVIFEPDATSHTQASYMATQDPLGAWPQSGLGFSDWATTPTFGAPWTVCGWFDWI